MAFIWQVNSDGYFWTGDQDERELLPLPDDRAAREYVPMEEHTGLFRTFAFTEPTEPAILAFANRYGLLGVGTMEGWKIVPNERLSIWESQILAMRDAVQRWERLRKARRRRPAHDDFQRVVNKYVRCFRSTSRARWSDGARSRRVFGRRACWLGVTGDFRLRRRVAFRTRSDFAGLKQ
jgi:hypothetical protein